MNKNPMTNRELIARALVGARHDPPFIWNGGMESNDPNFKIADALVTALDGRLLPDLPGDVLSIRLACGDPGEWGAIVLVGDREPLGFGPTIPAAITNALEEAAK